MLEVATEVRVDDDTNSGAIAWEVVLTYVWVNGAGREVLSVLSASMGMGAGVRTRSLVKAALARGRQRWRPRHGVSPEGRESVAAAGAFDFASLASESAELAESAGRFLAAQVLHGDP